MKKLITFLFVLGVAVSTVSCSMMKQSSQVHSAVENEICDVHKVIVKKASGMKTVTVVVIDVVTQEQKDQINELAKKWVPDANEVEIKIYRGKK